MQLLFFTYLFAPLKIGILFMIAGEPFQDPPFNLENDARIDRSQGNIKILMFLDIDILHIRQGIKCIRSDSFHSIC